jgi:hypothetical protein
MNIRVLKKTRTMKKIYMAPEMAEVKVTISQHLLINSIVMTDQDATTDGEGYYETLSREASVWDDGVEE